MSLFDCPEEIILNILNFLSFSEIMNIYWCSTKFEFINWKKYCEMKYYIGDFKKLLHPNYNKEINNLLLDTMRLSDVRWNYTRHICDYIIYYIQKNKNLSINNYDYGLKTNEILKTMLNNRIIIDNNIKKIVAINNVEKIPDKILDIQYEPSEIISNWKNKYEINCNGVTLNDIVEMVWQVKIIKTININEWLKEIIIEKENNTLIIHANFVYT